MTSGHRFLFLIIALAGLIALGILAWRGVLYVRAYPTTHPEETLRLGEHLTAFIERITLPLKLAKLARQEPDTTLRMPVQGVRVSGVSDTWGAARPGERAHEGQDIFATRGTPVFSATRGYVRRITENSELGGNNVLVTGAGGRRYYYAHLDRFADGLRVGQEVTTDTVLGFVGNTGNAVTTPPHLHFGMYEGRDALNPFSLLVDR